MANKVRSDSDHAAVRLGQPELHNAPIHLAAYDAGWPVHYEREAARIRKALGDRALVLEHAGSTSIPGLSAKPKIDIVLGVADSTDEESYVAALESAGYVLRIREADWHEHRLLRSTDSEVNLHVFTVGCLEIERMIKFRDHVRADDADRVLYERSKQDLAKRQWKYVQHYADAKSEVVEEILGRAGVSGARCERF